MTPRHQNALLAASVAAFAALAVALAVTRAPWWDEAWFSNGAYNLAVHGTSGTNLLVGTPWLPHIERYTYWTMPLYPLMLAGWVKVVGFGLVRVRLFSVVWGLVGLLAWSGALKALTGNRTAALLCVALVGLDASWVTAASDGRMDVMSAALGYLSYAIYLKWRSTGFRRAFLWAHGAAAAAVFTHPFGVTAFVGLWILALALDRDRMHWRTVLPAALPYVAAGALWSVYILQSPRDFLVQFAGNSSEHVRGLAGLAVSLAREPVRFLRFYTEGSLAVIMRPVPLESWFHRGLIAVPIACAVAVVAAVAVPWLRRRRDVRILLAIGATALTLCALLDARKRYYYLAYIAPPFGALAAVVVCAAWQRWPRARGGLAAIVGAVLLLDLGGASDTIRADTMRADYVPAARFLAAHVAPRDRVIGSAEMAYALGFGGRLVDDQLLGLSSGIDADWIVMNSRYAHVLNDPTTSPALRDSLRRRLTHGYARVYDSDAYRIYRRGGDSAGR